MIKEKIKLNQMKNSNKKIIKCNKAKLINMNQKLIKKK